MKITEILNKLIFPLLLLLVILVLFVTNYEPGTYLIGWDSLQTELNPTLAIKRALFSGWQEYQSFGLTSGMAHAADLVRSFVILLLSILLPTSIVRYIFHFLMIYLGGLGFFYLLKFLGFKKDRQVLAFIGALFYILNLGTIQIFSLPFEPFSIFFGLLPWEILVFLMFVYAKKITPKLLFVLVLVNVLATPQAYLQTLFIVYMLCLGFLSFGLFFESYDKKLLKRFVVAFSLIITVNLFWMLPQFYFLSSSVNVVKDSKINQLATDIVSRQNFEKGNIKNFARLEGFYYDLYDTNNELIFSPWHAHYTNFFVRILSYLPFVVLLLGFFKRKRAHYGFISIFILVSLMLLSNSRLVAYFNSFIFSHSFINQIFRSPFTKFVVPFSLAFSYLFVSGLEVIYNLILKTAKHNKLLESIVFSGIVASLIVVYSLPAFLGSYFAKNMKVTVPDSYTQAIEYFSEQDKNKRVALLPDTTFWGWFSNSWGYDGSGFIWYGLEQPVVSRTFDVWSLNSESYYWEIKYAIESIDRDLFEQVLEKYNIDYLILDYTVQPVSSIEAGLQFDQLEKILKDSDKVVLEKRFDGLDILKVNHEKQIANFITLADNIPKAAPNITITNKDQAFLDLGDYKGSNSPDVYYPFLDLNTQTDMPNKKWSIHEDEDNFIISADLSELNLDDYELVENETDIEATIFLGEEIEKYSYEIQEEIDGPRLEIKVKKRLVEGFDPTYVGISNCREIGDFGIIKRGSTLSVSSEDRGLACFGYESSLLDHWNGYLVKLNSENISGKEFFFYIFGNKTRKQSKLETNLKGGTEYFVLNPGYFFDDGYFFSFQNPSYEFVESKNKLNKLDVYLFPFEYLKNTKLVRNSIEEPVFSTSYTSNINVEKLNYYSYVIEGKAASGNDLILYQSYDPGWRAYRFKNEGLLAFTAPMFFGDEITEHDEFNNWANVWRVPELEEGENIVLFYWPQQLEYIGMIVLFAIWGIALVGVLYRL